MNERRIAKEISVLIPAFNARAFIRESIESILNQTVLPGEIIVINDGSTDGTSDFLKSLNIDNLKVLDQTKQGVAAALNLGITNSRGEILAFLDADDIWLPNKLEDQLEVINEVDMAFTLIENFIDLSIDIDLSQKLDVNLNPFIGIHKSTLLIKKKAFLKVGLFERERKVELLEWYARAKDAGLRESIVKKVLVKRRIHGSNQSILDKSLRNEFPKILKAILDRRRQK
ncbi:MAG: glycosyltransferase involved in cell wall biosynthesis [Sediminicola sp.]|jgi:glycosyltransferase involved in cell wall biosynthesis|tara:strand:+ start:3835 stop:4521 length:687 start_codon:yes stop_codon:yes gene_type:complete